MGLFVARGQDKFKRGVAVEMDDGAGVLQFICRCQVIVINLDFEQLMTACSRTATSKPGPESTPSLGSRTATSKPWLIFGQLGMGVLDSLLDSLGRVMGFLREAQSGPVQLNPWLIFGQLGVGVLDSVSWIRRPTGLAVQDSSSDLARVHVLLRGL